MNAAPITTPTVPAPSQGERIEELGRIILAYSEITEKLQQSHEQMTRTVARLQRELSEKNRQLERRNRLAALGEMAAGLAHEIRNPLGGIQLCASMLKRDLAGNPESQQVVEKIAGGVRRLDGLVSQVLGFSREIRANPADADLSAIVAQALEDAQPAATARGVRMKFAATGSFPVRVDACLILQAVLNLLLNAVEASEPGGMVAINALPAPTDNHARQFILTVRDSGSGISPECLDRIFDPFFTTKDTGTGLGLSIVHRIVEAHEGSITASNVPGGGAKFEIRI